MNLEYLPRKIRDNLIPAPAGNMCYYCLECGQRFDIHRLLYTCPDCGQVLMLEDTDFQRLKNIDGKTWREIFDARQMLKLPALRGIYRFHEFIGPIIPLEAVVYLGEGHTPVIEASSQLQAMAGCRLFYKNDGQNPSASFKDRGMASALSYINYLLRQGKMENVLAVCASTGDTSAAAALYSAYLQPAVRTAVLLPEGKVTSQQLAQPLGSGAKVFEIPGVFDDCMKIVEVLSERYNVALLNSKNAWRILGQESYSYEIAQAFDYRTADLAVVVPVGNAGNITAVMNGFLKFLETGIIDALPKIIGVQSMHADPVVRYYNTPAGKRKFKPVTVKPSVAQAAMIGNPVSMPRVIRLVDKYNDMAGRQRVFFVEVTEQKIMDWQLTANRHGHIACTHGGECLAGLQEALARAMVTEDDTAVLDSTAHALKFVGFQDMYFQGQLQRSFNVVSKPELINLPVKIRPGGLKLPQPGEPLTGRDLERFVQASAETVALQLNLKKG